MNVIYSKWDLAGYGHKKITVELEHDGKTQTFSATTNNMPAFDDATDLEGQEMYEALYNIVKYQLQDQVNEWLYNSENE